VYSEEGEGTYTEIFREIANTRDRTRKGMSRTRDRTDTGYPTMHEERAGGNYKGRIRERRVHVEYNIKCS
jgi:hypothetical protein